MDETIPSESIDDTDSIETDFSLDSILEGRKMWRGEITGLSSRSWAPLLPGFDGVVSEEPVLDPLAMAERTLEPLGRLNQFSKI